MEYGELLWGLVVAILGVTLAFGVRFASKGGLLIKDLANTTKFSATVTHVVDTVDTLIQQASTTIIAELKEKTADGKLTKEEINEIVLHVKGETLKLLSTESKLVLTAFIGDYDAWLTSKISVAVDSHIAFTDGIAELVVIEHSANPAK